MTSVGQRLDFVVGVRRASACRRDPREVQCHDVEPVVAENLAGLFFQEKRFWPPPCNIRMVGRIGRPRRTRGFHSSATRGDAAGTGELDRVGAADRTHGSTLHSPFKPPFAPGGQRRVGEQFSEAARTRCGSLVLWSAAVEQLVQCLLGVAEGCLPCAG